MNNLEKFNFFPTPVWKMNLPTYLKDLNKASDPYIKKAKKFYQKYIKERDKKNKKKIKDKYLSFNSTPLLTDRNFSSFQNLCAEYSIEFLNECGFDISKRELLFTEMWVQEFSQNGGGHHVPHVHYNQHVSGFYFLKCSEKTSYPVFHDPRPGALMTKIESRDNKQINSASAAVALNIVPGDLVIIPGYLTHEYPTDFGQDPFRFIHFNIQCLPKSEIMGEVPL